MVPEWMETVGSLGPFLLVVSVVVIAFGIYRLKSFVSAKESDREEEERKRLELLKKLAVKVKPLDSNSSQGH